MDPDWKYMMCLDLVNLNYNDLTGPNWEYKMSLDLMGPKLKYMMYST